MAMLDVQNVTVTFGGLTAVKNVCVSVARGELLSVIGPNGAGKTTLFNLLSGIYKPSSGDILFEEKSIKGLRVDQINRRGVARTFQNIRLFPSLSVKDNVKSAFFSRLKSGFLASVCAHPGVDRQDREIEEKVNHWLSLFHLADKKDYPALSLSYGEMRRLEIVRALATNPKLLLLDEPAAGMNRQEKAELGELILRIHRDYDLSVILIEHDMKMVMSLVPKIIVLDYGEVIAEGTPAEIRSNRRVIEAYLGEE